MTRTSLNHHNCSFARTVDAIGDRWTLMILRDAFYGVRRFSEFKRRIGVTQAVLSARLTSLVDHDLLEKHPIEDGAVRAEYRLTKAGRDLFPVVVALTQWGDRHIHSTEGSPVELYETSSGKLLDAIEVRVNGASANIRDVSFRPGPGARPETIEEFDRMLPQTRKTICSNS